MSGPGPWVYRRGSGAPNVHQIRLSGVAPEPTGGSDDPFRLTTEEQRERLHRARSQGGLCAGCGRALTADEVVYIERFVVPGGRADAPVGVECASPDLLEETEGKEPERCAGCGRPVYYRAKRRGRHRALCSRACINRVSAAKRAASTARA